MPIAKGTKLTVNKGMMCPNHPNKPAYCLGLCMACYKWQLKHHGQPRPDNTKVGQSHKRPYPWSLENFNEGYESGGRFFGFAPDHPRRDSKGYVRRSILAWEAYHGMPVPDGWVVHHKNGNTLDDSKENLQAMPLSDHVSLHRNGIKKR